ncbi:MAG: pepsin/retropepsin-like aspartic protease family protein [Rhizomicrobium sp.]
MTMSRICAAALAVGLTLCSPARAEESCGPLKLITVTDMIPDGYGRMTIPVGIADKPKRLVVDTGAYISSLDADTVAELGLQRVHSAMGIRDILGNVSEYEAVVPLLTMGRLKTEKVKLFIMPTPGGDHDGPPTTGQAGADADVAGLFGSDFMAVYDVDLDFGAKKFRLVSQDHCEGRVIYWHPANFSAIPFRFDDNHDIVLPMTLDGHKIKALLDTGADTTTMNGDIAKRIFDLDEGGAKAVVNGEPVAGAYAHRFQSLEIEGLTISNPVIEILPNVRYSKMGVEESWYWRTHGGDNDYQLILGMRQLKQLHVYIAYKEKMLYISAAGDRDAPPADAAH